MREAQAWKSGVFAIVLECIEKLLREISALVTIRLLGLVPAVMLMDKFL